jgi:hypothetical protein
MTEEDLKDRVEKLEKRVKILETAFQFFVFWSGQEGNDPSEMRELV